MTNTQEKIVGLSPMAGYTDSPFRALVRELCPESYLVTELISADGLKFCSEKTKKMMDHFPNEKPLIVQLFGKHPEFFAEAAKIAEAYGAAGIDINMGCPAKKVIHSGHGSALIQKPCLAFDIVKACVGATNLPVTVKTRLTWSRKELGATSEAWTEENIGTEIDTKINEVITKNLITFCKGLENAGAKMICIHGRTVKQEYIGQADWRPIYALKEALNIPVIGNGDVNSIETAQEKIKNLDGIFIGRGAIGQPWIIAQIHAALNGKKIPKSPDFKELKNLAIHHAQLAWKMKGLRGMMEMRKNLVTYLKGLPHASAFRQKLVHVESVEDVKNVLDEYEEVLTQEELKKEL